MMARGIYLTVNHAPVCIPGLDVDFGHFCFSLFFSVWLSLFLPCPVAVPSSQSHLCVSWPAHPLPWLSVLFLGASTARRCRRKHMIFSCHIYTHHQITEKLETPTPWYRPVPMYLITNLSVSHTIFLQSSQNEIPVTHRALWIIMFLSCLLYWEKM